MRNQFYDLKNYANLPPNAKYIDPYDYTPFIVKPKETLNDLTDRVNNYRISQNIPVILPDELAYLITTALFETSNTKQREEFFMLKHLSPSVSQILTLAKTLVIESLTHNSVNAKQRKERADKCNSCSFHEKHSSWGPTITKIITKLVGLNDIVESPTEKSLGLCRMCGGCDLKAKVKLTAMTCLANLTPEQIDHYLFVYGAKAFDTCWILNECTKEYNLKKVLTTKLKIGRANGLALLDQNIADKFSKAKKSV